jgi:DNA primase catalytic core
MTLSPEWLDQLRQRTTLSALIGKSVKLTRKGGESKGCCPFHNEKTPSFTINDDKGFYHCFGCGAHGDAIRWLTDGQGMAFMDAVKDLAAAAGMEVPAPSPQVREREAHVESVATALGTAADWYADQLRGADDIRAMLAERGIGDAAIERFGLGFAPPKKGVAACGISPDALAGAGLLVEDGKSGAWRDFFRNRVMIPVADARGRTVGFAGRAVVSGGPNDPPKYINSPDSDHFDKGNLLFNLHRAAPAARTARRLVIVEGQFDVVALDQAGIAESVAPMGTALTERQLERAWRVVNCPILLFDGDSAGSKAALRAVERAMPFVGPGQSLAIAQLPDGEDPDSLVRSQGRDAIEAAIAAAVPLADWLFQTLLDQAA